MAKHRNQPKVEPVDTSDLHASTADLGKEGSLRGEANTHTHDLDHLVQEITFDLKSIQFLYRKEFLLTKIGYTVEEIEKEVYDLLELDSSVDLRDIDAAMIPERGKLIAAEDCLGEILGYIHEHEIYESALAALKENDQEQLASLLPQFFDMKPLPSPHRQSLYHGVRFDPPNLWSGMSGSDRDAYLESYVDNVLSIRASGLKATVTGADHWGIDRNFRPVYFGSSPSESHGAIAFVMKGDEPENATGQSYKFFHQGYDERLLYCPNAFLPDNGQMSIQLKTGDEIAGSPDGVGGFNRHNKEITLLKDVASRLKAILHAREIEFLMSNEDRD